MKTLTKRGELIRLLRDDGWLSDAELARELGLSKSAVRWRRMNLQNELNILLKIRADISRKDLRQCYENAFLCSFLKERGEGIISRTSPGWAIDIAFLNS
ncbi:AsnC family transcriptional regulator [Thermococcus sp.]